MTQASALVSQLTAGQPMQTMHHQSQVSSAHRKNKVARFASNLMSLVVYRIIYCSGHSTVGLGVFLLITVVKQSTGQSIIGWINVDGVWQLTAKSVVCLRPKLAGHVKGL